MCKKYHDPGHIQNGVCRKMSNAANEQKIIERMRSEKEMEMMRHEISRLLDEELSKPAEDMDLQRIDELLDLLEADGPTRKQKTECWKSIQEKRKARSCIRWKRFFYCGAAAAAVLAAVFFVSFETAKAFQWTHLLKILAPVAETFGILSTSNLSSDLPVQDNQIYIDEETEYSQQSFLSLAEIPAEKNGFRVTPKWVPERFAFHQGAIYEDPDMADISITYLDGEDMLFLRTMILYDDENIFSYVYEKTLEEPITEVFEDITLSYYRNMDDNMMSVSWIDREAHYHLMGNITLEEVRLIVGSILE